MNEKSKRTKAILADVKRLACEYYALTGKPLGVTGEVAEFDAAEILGLELVAARTAPYDAIRRVGNSEERIQIKGRATSEAKPNQRLGRIKQTDRVRCGHACVARYQDAGCQ